MVTSGIFFRRPKIQRKTHNGNLGRLIVKKVLFKFLEKLYSEGAFKSFPGRLHIFHTMRLDLIVGMDLQ